MTLTGSWTSVKNTLILMLIFGQTCQAWWTTSTSDPLNDLSDTTLGINESIAMITDNTGPVITDLDITEPVITSLAPLFGPIAGGTNLTLTGRHFSKFIPTTLYIGPSVSSVESGYTNEDTVAYFRSLPANQSMIDEELYIAAEFREGVARILHIQLPYSFRYKGNPDINDIHPLEHIISGGTALTVSGSNMDAVAKPALKITQIYTFLSSAGPPAVFDQDTTTYYSECSLKNKESILCPMPKLDLPAEFITDTERRRRETEQHRLPVYHSDDTMNGKGSQIDGYHQPESSSGILTYRHLEREAMDRRTLPHLRRFVRKKRGSDQIPFQKGDSSLEFVFGFVLDGVDKFDDISKALPDKVFALFSQPTFKTWTEVFVFKPDGNSTISIGGDGMLTGATITDYTVNIGLSQCTVLNMADNLLTCAPPSDVPENHPNDTTRCGTDLFALVVLVGISENLVGCLEYRLTSGIPLLYIVLGVSVGGIILILLVACLPVCLCKKREPAPDSGHRGKATQSMNDKLGLDEELREIRRHEGDDGFNRPGLPEEDVVDNYLRPAEALTSTPQLKKDGRERSKKRADGLDPPDYDAYYSSSGQVDVDVGGDQLQPNRHIENNTTPRALFRLDYE